MADASTPPPSKTLLAAAAGGFGGALLGVLAAATMMGDGDNGDTQSAVESASEPAAEVAVAER